MLAIVAMIAALILPRSPQATSRQRLLAYAGEVAALLKSDREAARRSGLNVAADVDARGRVVRAGHGGRIVRLPEDVAVDALLPRRCNGRPALAGIDFLASGMSCGGVIRLSRQGLVVEVRVNWLTGAVEIVDRDVS